MISQIKMVDGSREEHLAYPRALGPMLVDLIIRHDLDDRSHLMHKRGL